MSYTKQTWQDHVTSRPHTYTETVNQDGTKTLTAAGEVLQQGSPMSAERFNHIESGIEGAHSAVSDLEADTNTALLGKVDKETGKGLSSNDYTTAEKNKLAGLSNYDDTAVNNAMVRADTPDEEGFSQLYKTVNGQRVNIDPKTSSGATPYIYMTVDEYSAITPETNVLYWVINNEGKHGVYRNRKLVEGESVVISPWVTIQQLVRANTFAQKYSVGDQFEIWYNNRQTMWDIVAINVATPANTSYTRSVTLMSHNTLETMMFDNQEINNSNTNRQNFGNNRYSYSNIRQWLNSSAAAGSWYTNQHSADAAPDYATTKAGFMSYFDDDFIAVLGKTKIRIAKNTVTDGGGYEDISNEYFYLASKTEVGLGNENNIAEGTLFPYFNDSSNRTKNNAWWLRTPDSSLSQRPRYVYYGDSSSRNANSSLGIVPVCNII